MVKRKQQAKEAHAARKQTAARRREAEEQARRAKAEEEARRKEEERSARLNATWSALTEEEQTQVEQRALQRMRDEIPFVYRMDERERAQGKAGDALSIAVRSHATGLSLRCSGGAGGRPAAG